MTLVGVCCALRSQPELRTGLVEPTQLLQERRADGGELGVGRQARLVGQLLRQGQPTVRPVGHADGDGAVEGDDGGGREVMQDRVEGGDPAPVGALDARGARVAGGDRGLQSVGAGTEGLGGLERGETATEEQRIPGSSLSQRPRPPGCPPWWRCGSLACSTCCCP